jgi:hypothetical protein
MTQTFFVGEQWNSHFEAILSQRFLQDYTCDMSWNDQDTRYINLSIYPTGNKQDDPITMRLTKRSEDDQKTIAAHVQAAGVCLSDSEGITSSSTSDIETKKNTSNPGKDPPEPDTSDLDSGYPGSPRAQTDEHSCGSSCEEQDSQLMNQEQSQSSLDATFNDTKNQAKQKIEPISNPL